MKIIKSIDAKKVSGKIMGIRVINADQPPMILWESTWDEEKQAHEVNNPKKFEIFSEMGYKAIIRLGREEVGMIRCLAPGNYLLDFQIAPRESEIAFPEDDSAPRDLHEKWVYISGPISQSENYRQNFLAAEFFLKDEGYIPINPAVFNSHLPENTTWEEYMETSLAFLKMCEYIYLLPGYDCSMGAVVEKLTAKEYGIKELTANIPLIKQRWKDGFTPKPFI